MKVQELSGVELAHAVAEAVGWKVQAGFDRGDRAMDAIVVKQPFKQSFRPHSSANDALEALRAMKGWSLVSASGTFGGTWVCIISRRIGTETSGTGADFAEALSRAIVAAHEAEDAKWEVILNRRDAFKQR